MSAAPVSPELPSKGKAWGCNGFAGSSEPGNGNMRIRGCINALLKTPHPSAPPTPSPQGEGMGCGGFGGSSEPGTGNMRIRGCVNAPLKNHNAAVGLPLRRCFYAT